MASVKIKNPSTGKEREVTRATLGTWRRRGWILVDKSKKTDLNVLRESKQEDVIETSVISEGEAQ